MRADARVPKGCGQSNKNGHFRDSGSRVFSQPSTTFFGTLTGMEQDRQQLASFPRHIFRLGKLANCFISRFEEWFSYTSIRCSFARTYKVASAFMEGGERLGRDRGIPLGA